MNQLLIKLDIYHGEYAIAEDLIENDQFNADNLYNAINDSHDNVNDDSKENGDNIIFPFIKRSFGSFQPKTDNASIELVEKKLKHYMFNGANVKKFYDNLTFIFEFYTINCSRKSI